VTTAAEASEKMHKVVVHLQDQFSAVRTGRATPALVDIDSTTPGYVHIIVRDTGTGIATHDMPVLFEMFGQSTSELPRDGGVGLGLYIVKRLTDVRTSRRNPNGAAGNGRSASRSSSQRVAKRAAARIGPTVCEDDGPMPILNRSKTLTAIGCSVFLQGEQ